MKETDRRKVEAQKNHRARQTEVQEIISRPPSAIVTWGLTVFSFVFISTLFLTWFIRYPDIIKAKIVITTEPAPINLFSRASGKIALLKIENSSLNKGEIVAYIESNARPKDIILADSLVMLPDSMAPKSTKPLILGDLQNAFSLWEKAKESKSFYYKNQVASKQIDHIERQISTYKRLAYTEWVNLKSYMKKLRWLNHGLRPTPYYSIKRSPQPMISAKPRQIILFSKETLKTRKWL